MSLSPEIQKGLQALYGSCPEPICAVDEMLQPLWQNAVCTDRLLTLAAHALRTSGRTPLLPVDEALCLRDTDLYLRCTAQPLAQEGKTVYLLRFTQAAPPMSGPTAAGSALSACAEEIRLTVSDALQSLADIYSALRDTECAKGAYDATDRMLVACYHLLNQSLRCAEYAWYEAAAAASPVTYSIVDLGQTARQLAETLQPIVGDLFTINCQESPIGMTVCVDRERLHFALLAILLTVQSNCDGDAAIHIRTEKSGNMVTVHMEAERRSDRKTNRTHRAFVLPTDDTAVSAKALLQRFCQQFGGKLLCRDIESGCTVSLQLPYTDLPGYFAFHSPVAALPPSRYSSYYVMLSSIVDFRYGEEN